MDRCVWKWVRPRRLFKRENHQELHFRALFFSDEPIYTWFDGWYWIRDVAKQQNVWNPVKTWDWWYLMRFGEFGSVWFPWAEVSNMVAGFHQRSEHFPAGFWRPRSLLGQSVLQVLLKALDGLQPFFGIETSNKKEFGRVKDFRLFPYPLIK